MTMTKPVKLTDLLEKKGPVNEVRSGVSKRDMARAKKLKSALGRLEKAIRDADRESAFDDLPREWDQEVIDNFDEMEKGFKHLVDTVDQILKSKVV